MLTTEEKYKAALEKIISLQPTLPWTVEEGQEFSGWGNETDAYQDGVIYG